jgi:23S rRNA (cytosine1962-C5)-methyltransferase
LAGAVVAPGPAGVQATARTAAPTSSRRRSRGFVDRFMLADTPPVVVRFSPIIKSPSGHHGRMRPPATDQPGFALLDAGNGRRLDLLDGRVLDRPAPSAVGPPRLPPADWDTANLRFDRETGWIGVDVTPWTVAIDGLTLELRPTDAGQIGLFPEHVRFWPWLRTALAGHPDPGVLHLFAHTGATTLALARFGARVTHVDASRPAVAWARHNAALSGLADRPIRWIVDDANAFTEREGRRGRRYDGFVIDPPSYGHGPRGSRWDLADALPDLLDACAAVATDDAVVLLTSHTTGLDANDLADALIDAFEPAPGTEVAAESIEETARSGAILPLGVAARMIRG